MSVTLPLFKLVAIGLFSVIFLFAITYFIGFSNKNVISKENGLDIENIYFTDKFTLFSDKFEHLGTLPTDYTCAGDSKSPPLFWINSPEDTQSFIVTMSSYWSTKYDSGIKYDWMVYNISKDLNYLEEDVGNSTRMGKWHGVLHGGTYPNKPHYYYVAPCSEGWGVRYYTFTIYALNKDVVPLITDDDSNELDVAINMIDYVYNNDIVIASANVTVGWERYGIPDDYIPPPDDPPPPPPSESEIDNTPVDAPPSPPNQNLESETLPSESKTSPSPPDQNLDSEVLLNDIENSSDVIAQSVERSNKRSFKNNNFDKK